MDEKTTKNVTTGLLVGCALGLVAWDLYVVATRPKNSGATISEVMTEAGYKRPIVAVGLGALVAHWFWQ